MADLSTLARPYARAAFDYANENGAVNEWEDFLFVASNVVNDKAFRNWLENPAITAEHKSAALVDLYDRLLIIIAAAVRHRKLPAGRYGWQMLVSLRATCVSAGV